MIGTVFALFLYFLSYLWSVNSFQKEFLKSRSNFASIFLILSIKLNTAVSYVQPQSTKFLFTINTFLKKSLKFLKYRPEDILHLR